MSRAWMPMYWGDYLADTPHFSTAQHGAYLLLIAFYWCNGCLPADENEIRKIAKCSPLAWNKIKRIVMAKFESNGRHKRIDIELAQAIERSESARARAMQRWQCNSQSQSHKKKKVPAADAAVEVVGEDQRAKLFRIGKTILVSFGIEEKRTGALIGQWLKARNDPIGILAAIEFARDHNVADAVAYVSAVIHGKGKKNGTGASALQGAFEELIDRAGGGKVAGNPPMVDVTPSRP